MTMADPRLTPWATIGRCSAAFILAVRPRAAVAMDSAAEPQNSSTSRVALMGRYCRINGASARWLP